MRSPRFPGQGSFVRRVPPTPLVRVRLRPESAEIWCKLEFLNPSGSTKDRIARYMLEKAWRQGALTEGGLVVEASSGSTSISLALVCAQMGLRFCAVMPEGVSNERQLMIRALGGEIVLTERTRGMRGALEKAQEIAGEKCGFYTRQFENPDNPEAHRLWTAQEVLAEIPGGQVDVVVSGVGTGGTIVGLYHGFRDGGCATVPVTARPVSGVLCEVECCSFSSRVPGVVEGISTLYRPESLENLLDLEIPDDLAIETTRELIKRGFPVGPSSGLNFAAALEAARRFEPDACIVTVFPDRMERYFSTELFDDLVGT